MPARMSVWSVGHDAQRPLAAGRTVQYGSPARIVSGSEPGHTLFVWPAPHYQRGKA